MLVVSMRILADMDPRICHFPKPLLLNSKARNSQGVEGYTCKLRDRLKTDPSTAWVRKAQVRSAFEWLTVHVAATEL